ncbi:hypothetical protein CVT26_010178 [Gymnopilus dilepis]|uniref:F-box domain-containing protein n=1 Tax=Gymnopilus dilepis TaxID=231916 RepID=A0A409WCX8_9AGAR|nr:hypothetical protein CVT26_010178 [Gymnopilus dilepis]
MARYISVDSPTSSPTPPFPEPRSLPYSVSIAQPKKMQVHDLLTSSQYSTTLLRLLTTSRFSFATNISITNRPIRPEVFMTIMALSSATLVQGFFHVAFEEVQQIAIQVRLPTTVIKMLALQKLRIHFFDFSRYSESLDLIRLPVIKDLWIESFDRYQPFIWEFETFIDWLASLSTSLERLVLADLPFCATASSLVNCSIRRKEVDFINLKALLYAMPYLRTLSLPPSVHVPGSLRVDIAAGALLQNLDVVELATCEDPFAIVSMVDYRDQVTCRSNLPTLTSLKLTIPASMDGCSGYAETMSSL